MITTTITLPREHFEAIEKALGRVTDEYKGDLEDANTEPEERAELMELLERITAARAKIANILNPTDTTEGRPAKEREIELARERYAEGSDDNIEVSDNARISFAPDGLWVEAWVYLPTYEDGSV